MDRKLIETYTDLFLQISNKIKDNCYLKGNVLLSNLFKESARGTRDLDMSVYAPELYYECVVPELEKFAQSLSDITYEIKDIYDNRSGGIVIKDSSGSVVFKVDVSLSSRSLAGVVLYDFNGTDAYGSSIEKILCDKCITTLSEKRYRRIKDFYDIGIILHSNMEYKPSIVLDLMIESVGIEKVLELLNNLPFDEDTLAKLNHAWEKLTIYNVYTDSTVEKESFKDLSVDIFNFYDKVRYAYDRR